MKPSSLKSIAHTRPVAPWQRVFPSEAGRTLAAVVSAIAILGLCLLGNGGEAAERDFRTPRGAPEYRAGRTGDLEEEPYWAIDGDQAFSRFSYGVSGAGDVNGDGFADIIVGAPLYDTIEGNAGRVFVYYGTASGPSPAPSWTMEGDQIAAELGVSVACAGDVNNDGYDDVIIGASHYDGAVLDMGHVYVFHGSSQGLSSTPAWTMEGDIPKAHLGFSVAGAGDVNGDGYDDVIIGSFNYRNPDMKEGRAYVYHGSESGLASTPAWIAESNQAYAYFAMSVAGAGDVNNDGYDDVIIGASHYDVGPFENAGRAYVFHGDSTGLSPSAAWIAEGNQANEYLGRSVAGAGDVNKDGYDDVIVGAPGYDGSGQDEGAAFVYLGGAAGVSATAAWTKEGAGSTAGFGCSVRGIGDVDGDEFDDVAVGADGYDNGDTDEGGAFIYRGSPDGPSHAHSWSAEGDVINANFGFSVAGAGDVDDDGQIDVLVGSPGYPAVEEDEGRAFVYRMGPDTAGPDVRVLVPNGGETWYVGNVYDITWHAADGCGVDSVGISYSTNGGIDYTPIALGHANDGLYSWTVPNAPSDQVHLKIVAYDPGLLTGEDVSDQPFSIVADTTGPTVTVLAPDGSETWYIGCDYEITWTAEDINGVDSVSIFYSVDGGESYRTIATGEPNDSSYVWTVPDSSTVTALMKVIAYDSKVNAGEDSSNGFFTIAADTVPPQTTVVSPNGGESLEVGAPWEITWLATDDNGVDSVSIYYSLDGGEEYDLIVSGESNDSSYVWYVPPDLSDSALVKVISYDRRDLKGEDVSDSLFSVVPDTTGPAVAVASPNGGEVWGVGGVSVITWTAGDPAGVDSVSIYYSTDGGETYGLISSGEANDSVYLWRVPDTPSDSVLVMVVAYDPSFNTGTDASDSLFAISRDVVDVPGDRRDSGDRARFWGNSPNPFAGHTEIAFYLPKACAVRLDVFDAAGRMVARLVDGRTMEAGAHRIPWDGKGGNGTALASGVYFCTLRTDDFIQARKMVLAY